MPGAPSPDDFWAFYLREHQHPANVALHVMGTTFALVLFVLAFFTTYWLMLVAVLCGYAFAWVGHFALEGNKPATFKHPIKSFMADWKLWWLGVTFQLQKEYQDHNLWE